MKTLLTFAVFVAIAVLCVTPAANATPIGTLIIANRDCGGGAGVTVSAAAIDFLPAGGGTGCISTGDGTLVNYLDPAPNTIVAGQLGTINDLPVNGPLGFFDIFGETVTFNLTTLGPPLGDVVCENSFATTAACSIPGTPFQLRGTGSGTTAILLGLAGVATDATGLSNWTGSFSTEVNLTPFQIQAVIAAPGGSVTSTYSGRIFLTSTGVPEPASMFLMGGGLIGLAFLTRRRARKA